MNRPRIITRLREATSDTTGRFKKRVVVLHQINKQDNVVQSIAVQT